MNEHTLLNNVMIHGDIPLPKKKKGRMQNVPKKKVDELKVSWDDNTCELEYKKYHH